LSGDRALPFVLETVVADVSAVLEGIVGDIVGFLGDYDALRVSDGYCRESASAFVSVDPYEVFINFIIEFW
jgi:hypothetical protein